MHASTQAGRQAGKQTGRHADRQIGTHVGRQADRHTNTRAGRRACRRAGRLAGRQARRGRQADTDRQTCPVLIDPRCSCKLRSRPPAPRPRLPPAGGQLPQLRPRPAPFSHQQPAFSAAQHPQQQPAALLDAPSTRLAHVPRSSTA
jgi:hypothetical protein